MSLPVLLDNLRGTCPYQRGGDPQCAVASREYPCTPCEAARRIEVMHAALHEVAQHADDEFGFMVNVRRALAEAER